MKATLRTAWESRAPRQRLIIAVLAVLSGLVLYALLLHSASQARTQLRSSAPMLREQAARLDRQALEYGRLRAAPAATASPADLRALVQARISGAGLAGALTRIEAADANQVTVAFGALPFADWLAWVASLQAQQVRLDSSRVEALATPGVVSVTATFARARP